MTVRKKVLTPAAARETLNAPPELANVLRTIRRFNPDEGETEMSEATETSDTPKGPRKVVKKGAKKVAKKVTKKVTAKKAAKENGNLVTLSELCDAAKVDPMTARRYLRNSDIEMGTEARWSWPKGSATVGQVKKLLASIGK